MWPPLPPSGRCRRRWWLCSASKSCFRSATSSSFLANSTLTAATATASSPPSFFSSSSDLSSSPHSTSQQQPCLTLPFQTAILNWLSGVSPEPPWISWWSPSWPAFDAFLHPPPPSSYTAPAPLPPASQHPADHLGQADPRQSLELRS